MTGLEPDKVPALGRHPPPERRAFFLRPPSVKIKETDISFQADNEIDTLARDMNPRAAAAFEAACPDFARPGWRRARIAVEILRLARLQWLQPGNEAQIIAPAALRREVAAGVHAVHT
jgi:hypothetical protein